MKLAFCGFYSNILNINVDKELVTLRTSAADKNISRPSHKDQFYSAEFFKNYFCLFTQNSMEDKVILKVLGQSLNLNFEALWWPS